MVCKVINDHVSSRRAPIKVQAEAQIGPIDNLVGSLTSPADCSPASTGIRPGEKSHRVGSADRAFIHAILDHRSFCESNMALEINAVADTDPVSLPS